MKLNLLGYSVLLCFDAVAALYPVNIGQAQLFNNVNHKFTKRNSDQEIKSFNVTHTCFGDQCKKVSEAIDKLTNTLSSIIQVKNQIKIGVAFGSYCERLNLCNMTDMIRFGYGGPGEYRTIKNKDGKEVSYPIALHKQLVDPSDIDDFMSTIIPDILLSFNSDDKYWFEGDGDIEAGQPDFFIVAAQTLIRGLGLDFTIRGGGTYEFSLDPKFKNDTKLSTYEKIFSPRYEFLLDNVDFDSVASMRFSRYILDTLIVTTFDGQSINNLLDPYAEFVFPNHTIPLNELVSYLKKTPLNEASQKLGKLFNTPDSLAIKLPSGNLLELETIIKVNETSYNSLYFSESKYLNTKDALYTVKVTKSEARLPSEKPEDWPTY
ncbi:hypothetical protein CONCODRAFT_20588, partial [Conidiobolus coronatus NRRL 28638]